VWLFHFVLSRLRALMVRSLAETHPVLAVVMPGTKELRAQVRVIDPRNEVVEYLVGIGGPPGTSDPTGTASTGSRCETR
jgi:hypothetical protein